MVLNIVISKTDYTPENRQKVANKMIENCDTFIDSGEHGTFTASISLDYSRGAFTRASKIVRIAKKLKI